VTTTRCTGRATSRPRRASRLAGATPGRAHAHGTRTVAHVRTGAWGAPPVCRHLHGAHAETHALARVPGMRVTTRRTRKASAKSRHAALPSSRDDARWRVARFIRGRAQCPACTRPTASGSRRSAARPRQPGLLGRCRWCTGCWSQACFPPSSAMPSRDPSTSPRPSNLSRLSPVSPSPAPLPPFPLPPCPPPPFPTLLTHTRPCPSPFPSTTILGCPRRYPRATPALRYGSLHLHKRPQAATCWDITTTPTPTPSLHTHTHTRTYASTHTHARTHIQPNNPSL